VTTSRERCPGLGILLSRAGAVKILDVSEFYAEQGGGVRTYTNQKLRAAATLGHELIVAAPAARDGEERRCGGRVVWIESPRFALDARYHVFVRASALHHLIARERPDVIEGSSVWSGGWFAASAPGRALKALVFHQDPVAVYPHTLLDGLLAPARIDALCGPYWAFLRRLSSRFDLTVAASAWLAGRLSSLGVANARAVPFGTDSAPFSPARRDPRLRAQLLARTATPEHGTLLVCVSRHHPEKRLQTLCRAVQALRARLPVGLVIFGDGPLRLLVERWAARAPGVHLAGFERDREQLARALASADALLHGSAAETYGIAVAEGLSAGLPVIVPDRGGAAELADPACAEFYRAGDVRACASAIEALIARDREPLRAAAARQARKVRSTGDHFRELFALYQGALRS
jgi:alpha-1,6-mannosyltransferase